MSLALLCRDCGDAEEALRLRRRSAFGRHHCLSATCSFCRGRQVTHWAAHYEHRIRTGQKAIYHLEAFVAKFMAIYKSWMVNIMADYS